MKLLTSIIVGAFAKDSCLSASGDPLATGKTPTYGGTCWNQWVSPKKM